MKSSQDPRHQKRISLMQNLFALSFKSDNPDDSIKEIINVLPQIDEKIQNAAPEWPLLKISKVDLAILRLSTFEMTVSKSEPPKVIIDEAVELAKGYGNENSPQFINGVLGTILKNI
jgi:transcription antitermination protein NusB